MEAKEKKSISKLMSLVLRHDPAKADLTLKPGGWVKVDELLNGLSKLGRTIDRKTLDAIVETNDKKRFTFSEDGNSIRAAQGHSARVDMEYAPSVPPAILYHGTSKRNQAKILDEGLKPMSRQYVHLSADTQTARTVGTRHGKPVIFEVATAEMHAKGIEFYQAENGVWLTASVTPEYLKLLDWEKKHGT